MPPLVAVMLGMAMLAVTIVVFVNWKLSRPQSQRERDRAARYELRRMERNPLPPVDWEKYRN